MERRFESYKFDMETYIQFDSYLQIRFLALRELSEGHSSQNSTLRKQGFDLIGIMN